MLHLEWVTVIVRLRWRPVGPEWEVVVGVESLFVVGCRRVLVWFVAVVVRWCGFGTLFVPGFGRVTRSGTATTHPGPYVT